MSHREVTIAQLKNIGPTISRRLTEIGIHTKADLEAIGSVAAYRRICEKHPGTTIPVCYYLYSLEGALRGVHWDAIGATVKRSLWSQVSPTPSLGQRNEEPADGDQKTRMASPEAKEIGHAVAA